MDHLDTLKTMSDSSGPTLLDAPLAVDLISQIDSGTGRVRYYSSNMDDENQQRNTIAKKTEEEQQQQVVGEHDRQDLKAYKKQKQHKPQGTAVPPVLDRIVSFRLAVAYLFCNKYRSSMDEDPSSWKGRGGVVSKIRNDLGLHEKTNIHYILQNVLECRRLGIRYTGEINYDEKTQMGRPKLLTTESTEAQIAAAALERGSNMTETWNLVNDYRRTEGLPTVSFSTVRVLCLELKASVPPKGKIRKLV